MGTPGAFTQPSGGLSNLSLLPRLPLIAKLTYAFGMLGYVAMLRMMTGWLQKFLVPPDTTVAAAVNVIVPLWVYVAVMVVGRVYFDSVTDPVIGYWSDHTKSRWGRRKPFILAGGIPCVVCFLGLFALAPDKLFGLWAFPDTGSALVVNSLLYTVLVTVYWIATTLMAMPFLALLPEITPHPADRRQVSTLLGIMVVFGVVLGQVLPGLMGSLFHAALLIAAVGIASFCSVLFLFRPPKQATPVAFPMPHESSTTVAPASHAALAAWPRGHAVTEGAQAAPDQPSPRDDDGPTLDFRGGMTLLWHTMWFAFVLAPRTLLYGLLRLGGKPVRFFREPHPAAREPEPEPKPTSGARAAAEHEAQRLDGPSFRPEEPAWPQPSFVAIPKSVPEPLRPLGASMRSILVFKPFIGFLGAFVALHAAFVLVTTAFPYMPQTMLGVNDARNYVLLASGQPIPVPDPLGAFAAARMGHDVSPFADAPLLPAGTMEAVRLELTHGDADAPLEAAELGKALVARGLLTPQQNAEVVEQNGALDRHGNFRASIFFALCLASAFFIGIPLCYVMLKFVGKRVTASMCIFFFIVGPAFAPLAGLGWVPISGWLVIYFVCLVTGIGLAGIFVVENLMLSDVVQLDLLRTGLRRESLYFGLFGLMMKIGIGIALAISGATFDLFGYAYLADWGVRLAGPGSSLIAVAGALVFWAYYPTDREMADGRIHGEADPPERMRTDLRNRTT